MAIHHFPCFRRNAAEPPPLQQRSITVGGVFPSWRQKGRRWRCRRSTVQTIHLWTFPLPTWTHYKSLKHLEHHLNTSTTQFGWLLDGKYMKVHLQGGSINHPTWVVLVFAPHKDGSEMFLRVFRLVHCLPMQHRARLAPSLGQDWRKKHPTPESKDKKSMTTSGNLGPSSVRFLAVCAQHQTARLGRDRVVGPYLRSNQTGDLAGRVGSGIISASEDLRFRWRGCRL